MEAKDKTFTYSSNPYNLINSKNIWLVYKIGIFFNGILLDTKIFKMKGKLWYVYIL